MIKALVVDDEKRVRQGFISLANWSSYGIEIAGEAKDGLSALEALGSDRVDLMFVDISMPGMSGFELIEQARERHPWTKAVILTCHHEFDYVQEALRLGAIDYIVKTLLNKNNVDETMHRIVKRYAWETRGASAPPAKAFRFGAAFCPLKPGARPDLLSEALPPSQTIRPLEQGLWLAPMPGRAGSEWIRDLPAYVTAEWQPVRVTSASDMPQSEAEALIGSELASYLFYRDPADVPDALELEELKRKNSPSEAELDAAFESWKQLRWLIFTEDWKQFIERIEEWRIPPQRLRRFLTETAAEWSGLLGWETENEAFAREIPEWRHWKPLKNAMSKAALLVQQRMAELSLSREVFASLVRAVLYMKEQMGRELNQDDVARRVGMSRSYFSQCFKRFAGGEQFGDALRKMRIERARELLGRTELSVREIANRVGFEDEKYFSRVYREKMGILPTEYRKSLGAGGEGSR
ncbi:response regulator [Cohnella xylanilytica]|uniref:Response regulator n=1 Tax=Cohnella xylanilytica TaxID=557555 RepID=A0A841TWA7_9BACL|nr:response regulator [Cohnella xylanilytica]MBB6691288.1 response regulator [Cohnella xylanilytica]